jgi:hypothetical protein
VSTRSGADGVHARIAVEPADDCPLRALAESFPIRDLIPADAGSAPQLVLDTPHPSAVGDETGVDPVVSTDGVTICRLPGLAPSAGGEPCSHDHCLAQGFGFLPVEPYSHRWAGTQFLVNVAATDGEQVEAAIDRFREAGFAVSTEQLSRGGDGVEADTERAVVDLTALTTRQRELARFAAERDYFDPEGPSAETIAAELDIAKATFSEHLRTVQAEVAGQLFSADE